MSLAVVTGASRGLGAEIASILARRGYALVLVNRSRLQSEAVLARLAGEASNARVEVVEADLADQAAITRAAAELIDRHPRIDLLFNNAGVLLGGLTTSRHGNEMHFQVNTLAPYMLMRLLRPALAASHGRVMNVSSGAIAMTGRLRIDELQSPARMRRLTGPYAQSKLALTALTHALAAEFARDGVILRSGDPGGNRTDMTAGDGMPTLLRWLQPAFFKNPERGAHDLVAALLDTKFGTRTGVFIAGGRIKSPPADALDPAIQRRLSELCEALTGV